MNLHTLYYRFRWVHLPATVLTVLLQRLPVLRMLLQGECLCENGSGSAIVKSVFALTALGAYNSVAGATTFSVAPATPSSGVAGTQFAINGTTGSVMTVSYTLSGAPGNPRAWSVVGTLPTGLSVTGGNPVNVTAPYKMTITGTPTTQGTWTVTVKAWESSGATGKSASISCTFTITAGTTTSPPSFTTQPAGASANVGGAATFTVAVTGSPSPTLQWYRDSTLLTGQTATTLSLSNIQTSDAGSYSVVATNSAGTATSTAAILKVNVAPAITTQPSNQVATVGGSATFSVAATGTAPMSYQWKKAGANIAGATSASYTIANVQTTDAASYTVTVTNSVGSVTSGAATLTVNSAPAIATQPQGASVVVGSSVSFSAVATGSAPLSYQWLKDGNNIVGATSATYTIASAQLSDAGSYTLMVTNGSGSATSSAAVLTVSATAVAPSITSQPQGLTVTVGGAASFSVTASGSAPMAYQWQKGGAAISGATGSTFTISNSQLADAGTYRVVVTNGAGSATSSGAVLTVNPVSVAPTITVQPVSHAVASGHDVSFIVAVAGYPAPACAWYVSTDSGSTWSAISNGSNYAGATTVALTVKSAMASMNGYLYRCAASNSTGSINSFAATLTVTSAILPAPSALVVSSAGTLTVSDSSNNTIQTIGTSSWAMTSLAGSAGQLGAADGTGMGALFRQPNGVAVDSSGTVYVADTGNSTIRKISSAGVVTTVAGSASNQGYRDGNGTAAWFSSPAALAVDGVGNVYVADSGNAVIRKIAVDGTVTTVAGTAGATGTADGTGSAARFNQPSGITVDSAGTLFVSDTYNQTIRKISPAGVVTTLAGLGGVSGSDDGTGAAGLFNQPRGLCVDTADNLYVADTANCSIRKISAAGVVTTFAGLSTVSGLLDGSGTDAWFNQPRDVKIDSAGNLFVADTGNAVIRMITPSGVVTTASLSISAGVGGGGGGGTTPGAGSSASDSGPAPGKAGAGDLPAWLGTGCLLLYLGRWLWNRNVRSVG